MKNFYSIKLEPIMGVTIGNCIKEGIELAEFTKIGKKDSIPLGWIMNCQQVV